MRGSVVLLAILCVLAAQAVAASVLLAFPSTAPPAMTPGEVAGALLSPGRGVPDGLRLSTQAAAPFAPSDRPYTRLVARTLQVLLAGAGIREVRVHSLSDAVALHTHGAPVSIPTAATALDPAGLRALAAAPFPSFATAVLRADGRWTVLTPAAPLVSPDRLQLAIAFALSLLILTPLTWWCARRLTRPLQILARASQALERDPGAPPLPVVGPAEVRVAASAFNAMQAGLVRQMEDRITLMAAIAHDLRTPLTSLRLRAETASPEARTSMVADIARMEALVSDLLIYVRGARPSALRQTFDLAELAAKVVKEARRRGWDVTLRDRAPARVSGDPLAVRRAMENLVENAHRHAGGGRVSVGQDGLQAWFAVEDDGPGLPEGSLEAVFQPFVRLETSRSLATGGSGLGLAITRSIARAHGGDASLSSRHPQGLRARLELPIQTASFQIG